MRKVLPSTSIWAALAAALRTLTMPSPVKTKVESAASGSQHECAHPHSAGVWIVNSSSGYFHRAVRIGDEDSRLVWPSGVWHAGLRWRCTTFTVCRKMTHSLQALALVSILDALDKRNDACLNQFGRCSRTHMCAL